MIIICGGIFVVKGQGEDKKLQSEEEEAKFVLISYLLSFLLFGKIHP